MNNSSYKFNTSVLKASTHVKRLLGVLVVISLVLTLGSLYIVAKGIESKKWPSVSGKIVESKLIRQGEKTVVKVVYVYKIDGKEFRGTGTTVESLFNITTGDAKALAREYRRGQSVPVYYNPKNLSESLLKPGIGKASVIFSIICTLLTFFGIVALRRFGSKDTPTLEIPSQSFDYMPPAEQAPVMKKERRPGKSVVKSRALNFITTAIFLAIAAYTFFPMLKPAFYKTSHREKVPGKEAGLGTSSHHKSGTKQKRAQNEEKVWKEVKKLKTKGFRLLKDKNYTRATRTFKKCIALLDTIGGKKRRAYPFFLNYTAFSLYKEGKLDESLSTYKKSIATSGNKGRSGSLAIAMAYDGMGRVYARQNKLKKAENMFRKSIRIWNNVRGGANGNSVSIMYRCASVLEKQGKYEEAKAMREKAERDLAKIKAKRKKR